MWVPLETPTFLLPFPFVSREAAGRLGGVAGDRQGKTLSREKEKNDREAFSFFDLISNELLISEPGK